MESKKKKQRRQKHKHKHKGKHKKKSSSSSSSESSSSSSASLSEYEGTVGQAARRTSQTFRQFKEQASRTKTTTTTLIFQIFSEGNCLQQQIAPSKVATSGTSEKDKIEEEKEEEKEEQTHSAPKSVLSLSSKRGEKWIGNPIHEKNTKYYSAVKLGGVVYSIGESVRAIVPGKTDATYYTIVQNFEKHDTKYAHLRLFIAGEKTLLGVQ